MQYHREAPPPCTGMVSAFFTNLLILGGVLSIFSSAEAALQGRLPATDEGTDYQAYYDTVLDVTWLQDANYAKTSNYDGDDAIYNDDGIMSWDAANEFIARLNSDKHLGAGNWRLPAMVDIGEIGCTYPESLLPAGDCGYNSQGEMAHIYYDVLGNTGSWNPYLLTQNSSWGLYNTDPFSQIELPGGTAPGGNLFANAFWYGLEYGPNPESYAWIFNFYNGKQQYQTKTDYNSGGVPWPVRNGDIGTIPEPCTGVLSVFALLGFLTSRQRLSLVG